MKDYILDKKWSLLLKITLLISPIIFGGWFILTQFEIIEYFNDLSKYYLNSVLILFIFIALIPVFVNLVYYINDSSELLFSYKGQNKKILYINKTSFWSILIISILILVFIVFIIAKCLTFREIVYYNRILSLVIFCVFLLIDILAIWSNNIEKNEISDGLLKNQLTINIKFSQESTFFINIPTILIMSLSIWFTHSLEQIDFYKQMTVEKGLFLFDPTILIDKELLNFFINGIETGILMASIVFSQIVFFIIKTRWDYKSFAIQDIKPKNEESPAGNKVYKKLPK